MTHQRTSDGARSRVSTTSGVATLYGRLATSFVGAGTSAPTSTASASPNTSRTFRARRERRAERRLERAVELDRVDDAACSGEVRVRTPRPGPTSSTTSSAASSASRPMTPRMFSSTRKCWPSAFFGATVTGARTQRRVRVGPGRERVRVLAARVRERRDGVDDVRRLVRAAADRLRREVRAVRLDEDPVARDRGRAARGARPPSGT